MGSKVPVPIGMEDIFGLRVSFRVRDWGWQSYSKGLDYRNDWRINRSPCLLSERTTSWADVANADLIDWSIFTSKQGVWVRWQNVLLKRYSKMSVLLENIKCVCVWPQINEMEDKYISFHIRVFSQQQKTLSDLIGSDTHVKQIQHTRLLSYCQLRTNTNKKWACCLFVWHKKG